MRTIYAACLARLGLSQDEAAALHGVALDTVRSWATGRRSPPPGIWEELRNRRRSLDAAAQAALDAWRAGGRPNEVAVAELDGEQLLAVAELVLTRDTTPRGSGRRER